MNVFTVSLSPCISHLCLIHLVLYLVFSVRVFVVFVRLSALDASSDRHVGWDRVRQDRKDQDIYKIQKVHNIQAGSGRFCVLCALAEEMCGTGSNHAMLLPVVTTCVLLCSSRCCFNRSSSRKTRMDRFFLLQIALRGSFCWKKSFVYLLTRVFARRVSNKE
jgi:hypothetical protein